MACVVVVKSGIFISDEAAPSEDDMFETELLRKGEKDAARPGHSRAII